jgi:signal transduction histidine kinase
MFGISPSIRWRLATISAALTFVILCAFAIAIGTYTTSRIKSDFDNEIAAAVDRFTDRLRVGDFDATTGQYTIETPDLANYGKPPEVSIRVLQPFDGKQIGGTRGGPQFPVDLPRSGTQIAGYRIETRQRQVATGGETPFLLPITVQYARRASDVDATIARVRLFLILGVLAGTGMALAAGLLLASRAMKPIAELTATASEITRTGDPNRAIPLPDTEDEIAELAATLDEMLKALSKSRAESEATLARQRKFVADASHELRTPLTSVLANLELLAADLDGERGEAAQSALRSSRRMRRLVADLLLLARADSQRDVPHHPTDVGKVLVDAAAELGSVSGDHELSIDAKPAIVDGAPDELHRLTLNLMENAIHHTPPGTVVKASVKTSKGDVVLCIEDNGPGIPAEVRDHLFERFVRAGDDHAGSFGLGLSIVDAVTKSHGGTVKLERPKAGGTRFVVRLPQSIT